MSVWHRVRWFHVDSQNRRIIFTRSDGLEVWRSFRDLDKMTGNNKSGSYDRCQIDKRGDFRIDGRTGIRWLTPYQIFDTPTKYSVDPGDSTAPSITVQETMLVFHGSDLGALDGRQIECRTQREAHDFARVLIQFGEATVACMRSSQDTRDD